MKYIINDIFMKVWEFRDTPPEYFYEILYSLQFIKFYVILSSRFVHTTHICIILYDIYIHMVVSFLLLLI